MEIVLKDSSSFSARYLSPWQLDADSVGLAFSYSDMRSRLNSTIATVPAIA